MYQLTRTLPNGDTKQHRPMRTMEEVRFAASYVLIDNVGIQPSVAKRFARALTREPLGTELEHATSGYVFRVTEV